MEHAIIASKPGGTEVLQKIDINMPVPSATDVLIRQTAVGVNFIDVYFRSGLYPWPVEKNLILGSEGAGVVEEVGSGVPNFSIGDRVAYTIPNGGYATYDSVGKDTIMGSLDCLKTFGTLVNFGQSSGVPDQF